MRKTAGLPRQKEGFSSHPVTFPQGSAWAPKSSGLRLSRDLAQVSPETTSPADREQSRSFCWSWL